MQSLNEIRKETPYSQATWKFLSSTEATEALEEHQNMTCLLEDSQEHLHWARQQILTSTLSYLLKPVQFPFLHRPLVLGALQLE